MTRYKERATAGYVMTDFSFDHLPFTNRSLPFGLELDGNFGYRVVRTKVQASGTIGLTSALTTANFDPAAPNAVGGTVTATTGRATRMEATTTDYLPILSLALWLVPNEVVLRYNRAKQVARPPVTALIIFAGGRNLSLSATSNSQGEYAGFADGTTNLLAVTYAGRRIMVGVNYRN